ncbi:MAG: branched-chain amino acid aminotransferase [Proteobacteria bacterium]|nr:branched-chain amino acid aminotransferase [Pseudomonadota bacterium]MBU1742298.1 branched-chain amino acid aminotransferase [Pseudomonadota bacterium]
MALRIEKAAADKRKAKPADQSRLGFGRFVTDHMLRCDWTRDQGWHEHRIVPYGPLNLDPAALVLHYGQQVFEGLKAYYGRDGAIHLFRPRDNLARLNRSARRLCLPEVDVEDVMAGLRELILLEKDWIPTANGASLYIRPTLIASEAVLGVQVAAECLLYIIVGPVGAYYAEGFAPTKIFVTERYVRAVIGGVGEAKTSANYAASLLAAEEAYAKGYTQVLWLDACDKKSIEEVGTSNIFFKFEDELVTPPLTGSILPGITRDTVLTLARDRGLTVNERRITIDEVIAGCGDGSLQEAFATGTAAVISPVGEINHQGQTSVVGDGRVGELSRSLYDEILDIQYGRRPDPHNWVVKL